MSDGCGIHEHMFEPNVDEAALIARIAELECEKSAADSP
jgi:hypothetical protein